MKIVQGLKEIPSKQVQFSKFKYYALIGSENSQLKSLINENKIQIGNLNTYASYEEQFFGRIIIPQVNQTAFKLQIHISEYYQQLYPFRNAYIFITKQDIDSYYSVVRSQPINVIKLLQLCLILCFENIIISLESEDWVLQFQAIETQIYEELKVLNLPAQSKVQYKINQPFSIKELKTNFNKSIDYLKVNFVVTNEIDQNSAEIVVLQGVLIKGQSIWIDGEKVCISKIVTFQKDVSFAFTNQIVIITVDKIKVKMHKGSVGRYRGFCKANMSVEMIALKPPKEKQKVCRDIFYHLSNWKKSITLENQKCEMQILFNDNQHLLQYNRYPCLISFSQMTSDIIAVGTLKINIEEATLPQFIIPRKFISTFTEECETQNCFIKKCRICKIETIDCILIPCGHLRYCLQCAHFKNCMYCESEIKSTAKIAIQEIDPHKYLSLTRGYVDEDYLKHTNYQIVPPMIQFELTQQSNNPNHFYKCEICKKELFTHIMDNTKFTCQLCGLSGKSSYKIQYS